MEAIILFSKFLMTGGSGVIYKVLIQTTSVCEFLMTTLEILFSLISNQVFISLNFDLF